MNVQVPPRSAGNGANPAGRRKPRRTPKGRQVDPQALDEVRALLGERERRRDLLIEHLHLIQDRYGHLSAAHLAALAEEMKLALTEVYEVATFYAHFDVVKEGEAPPPPVTVRVCDSLSCAMAGAEHLLRDLPQQLGPDVRVVRAPCMGACDRAPVCAVGHAQVMHATTERVAAAAAHPAHAHAYPTDKTFDAYLRDGGYTLLKQCLAGSRTRDDVIKAVSDAGLRGLGGAGFPTGRKWSLVRAEPAPRLFAVNGDEGEPGTFKDRYYLERDPHRFIEGMLIAAWVVEAPETYIYLRDEYPEVRLLLADEIAKVEQAGLSRHTKLHLRRGAGAYICGEESAMIEFDRGQARPAAPSPALRGAGRAVRPARRSSRTSRRCSGCATSSRRARQWFTSHGRRERKGLRSFSVSGRVNKPGVVLAPAGVTARELIDEFCGGMQPGCTLQGLSAGRRLGRDPAGVDGRSSARFRNPGEIRLLRRVARGCDSVRPGRYQGGGAQPDALLRGRELRPMHAVPGRHREGRQADGNRTMERGVVERAVGRHARRLDLRPRPGGAESAAVRVQVFPRGIGEAVEGMGMSALPQVPLAGGRRQGLG